MTTVINTPGNSDSSGGALGLIVGIIVLIIVGALFFIYVLPMINSSLNNSGEPKDNTMDINVQLPPVEINNPEPAAPTGN